jgi:3-phenylpropionate/trans-cinnamate dioxygenase ferredoxin reductase subunit
MAKKNNAGETVIIAGAGHCGGRVAQELRALGFRGSIRLFGDEADPPYERPPLSKGVLSGEVSPETLFLNPRSFYESESVDFHCGVKIDAICTKRRLALASDGQRFCYDHLVIATGGTPRTITSPPNALGRISTLKTLTDVRRLQDAIRPGSRVCIIGAGFLGMEVGATLKSLSCAVTIIERGSAPLAQVLPPVIGVEIGSKFAAEGIKIIVDSAVSDLHASDEAIVLSLSPGNTLKFDIVITAIGQIPVCPLIDGKTDCDTVGIRTDAFGRTAWPSIFAAGDVANSFRPRLNEHRRYESWANAEHQARTVARVIMGLEPETDPVAWFWTEHFGMMLRIAGDLAAGSELVSHRSEKDGTWLWFALDSRARLVGAAAYGTIKSVVRPMRLAEKAIASGRMQDPNAMAKDGAITA